MLGNFSRRRSRSGKGKAGLEFEVHPLPLDHQRPLLDVGMDRADVLPDNPHGNQLNRTEEEDADYQGRDADREAVPVQQLIEEIGEAGEDAEGGPAKPENVTTRSGTLERLVIPSIAMSYRE